jgi:hypothetical protein
MAEPVDRRAWVKTSMAALGSVAVRKALCEDHVCARDHGRTFVLREA